MSLFEFADRDLLLALYEGPLEERTWSTFLERLLARVDADYANLHLLRGGAPITDAAGLFHVGARPVEALRQLYYRDLHRLDPAPRMRMTPDRSTAIEALLEPGNADHERFRREFLVPAGMDFTRIVRVVEPDGGNAWLTVSRGRCNFPAAVDRLMEALAPHLTIALRNFVALGRERLRATLLETVVHRLHFGWLMLDMDGRVIDRDRQSPHILDGIVDTEGSRIVLADEATRRTFIDALRAFARGERTVPCSVHVSDEPWLDMLVLPLGDRAVLGTGEKPVAVAYLHGERSAGADRREQLRALFGLSSREADLALAFSRGLTIADSAAEFGLTVETVRTYSKRLYAKTDTRGRTDLVRLILASVVALV